MDIASLLPLFMGMNNKNFDMSALMRLFGNNGQTNSTDGTNKQGKGNGFDMSSILPIMNMMNNSKPQANPKSATSYSQNVNPLEGMISERAIMLLRSLTQKN